MKTSKIKTLLFSLIPLSYLLITLFQRDLSLVADLGRHLKIGEIVTNCLCVPQTNLFSYTNSNFPIVNHEWAAEVIFYLTSKFFGLDSLLILKFILIFAAASLLYSVALKYSSIFWVVIFSLLAITLFSMRFFVLPELFSYLFIALFIFFIERWQVSKKLYFLMVLPLLEILWVNMHIYFIIGIVIYFSFVFEKFMLTKKFDRKLIITGLALIISTLINPSFARGALLPFTFSSNYNFNVEENNSPFTILNPSTTNSNIASTLVLQIIVFEILFAAFFITLILIRQKKIFHFGTGAIGAILAAKYTRCVALFGILGFIPLSQSFTLIEQKLAKNLDRPAQNIIRAIAIIIVGVIITLHIKGMMDYKILHFGFEPSAENAATFIKSNNINGRIFNNYIAGNYLIYALYPKQKVYIDARPEAYPAGFFEEYKKMLSDPSFFKQQAERYKINAVVFNVALEDPAISHSFLLSLINDPGWDPVYADGIITIVLKKNRINESTIKKYKLQ